MQPSDIKYIEWHDAAWRQLWGTNGLPHALLLTGPEGIGKGRFALAAAARLLCESPVDSDACGKCPSCHWFVSDNHPDFRHIIPAADVDPDEPASDGDRKKGSRQILIDQIRELEDFVFIGSHRNGPRVVVVEPAEAMNHSAQNALLKILEEPPSSVYFILVSSHWRRLLPTVRSRCRTMPLPRPPIGEPVAETERGPGSIVTGIFETLAEPGRDPLQLASRWQNQLQLKSEGGLPMEAFVQLIQKWLFDLALFKLSGRNRLGINRKSAIQQLADKASASALIRCYNDLMKFRALASHPLNPQLFLEDVAERYLRALAAERS